MKTKTMIQPLAKTKMRPVTQKRHATSIYDFGPITNGKLEEDPWIYPGLSAFPDCRPRRDHLTATDQASTGTVRTCHCHRHSRCHCHLHRAPRPGAVAKPLLDSISTDLANRSRQMSAVRCDVGDRGSTTILPERACCVFRSHTDVHCGCFHGLAGA
ncbi:hypothetical protein J6590_038683 [Homalodisca vitripennis]|nr:hypothetical protein J6590_038683 [Homalodisca vitripennis]